MEPFKTFRSSVEHILRSRAVTEDSYIGYICSLAITKIFNSRLNTKLENNFLYKKEDRPTSAYRENMKRFV